MNMLKNLFKAKNLLLVGLLLVAVFASACTTSPTGNAVLGDDVEWQCSQVACEEFITGQQWAQENCVQNGGETVCPVVDQTTGQQVLVPLENIDLSQIQQCVSFVCVQETPVRPANYTIDPDALNI